MEATAPVGERSVDSYHVDCWANDQEVGCQELCGDWRWAFVVVIETPDFDGGYGWWQDDYLGYMKNGNYDEGLERVGEVALEGMEQRRKSV